MVAMARMRHWCHEGAAGATGGLRWWGAAMDLRDLNGLTKLKATEVRKDGEKFFVVARLEWSTEITETESSKSTKCQKLRQSSWSRAEVSTLCGTLGKGEFPK